MKAAGFQQHSVKPQDRRYLENVNPDCGSSVKNWMGYARDLFTHTSVTLNWIVLGYSYIF